jgi:putative ABC transport system permease protein
MRDWQAYVRSRLRVPDLTPEREARVVRELASQLEDFEREARTRGMDETAAEAHAKAQITDWDRLSRDVLRADRPHTQPAAERLAIRIESRGGSLMFAHLLRDGRFAVRQLLRKPGFTTIAILTLALGIGATSAMFSVVNGVLLKPMPYPDSDALVRVNEVVPQYGAFSVAPANFLDWRQQNGVFERIGAYSGTGGTFAFTDGPERIQGSAVSWDIFELLRIAPAKGSGFTAAQDVPNANTVIVLSHALWERRFNSDPSVVGRPVTVNGTAMTIAGVMPASFFFPNRTTEFWRPIALNPANATRGGHFLGVIARLKPGVAIGSANVEMKSIAERLAAQYPNNSAGESAEVVSMHEQVVGSIRPALLTLFAAVGVVVLIACANVANLLLVRASVREKEIAVRTALGAGRGRLAMQMFVESAILGVTGGAVGLLLAYLIIPTIQTLGAGSVPRVADVAIDGRVLAFTMVASLLTGLLFGLAPAWQVSRDRSASVLKEGGRSSTTTGGRWVRSGLLVGEVALSIVLLVGATLLLRSFARITHVDPGFKPEGVLAFQIALPAAGYPDPTRRIAFFDSFFEKLQAAPDVRAAGMVQALPMRGGYVLSFDLSGRPKAEPGKELSANHRVVTPGYFPAMGIPLRRGRLFTDQDREKSKMVALVDEAFVKRHFPEEEPIGRGVDIGNGTDGFYEIVGVVGDVQTSALGEAAVPTMYVPYKQDVFSQMWVVARAGSGDPARMTGAVRQVLRDIDPTLPAFQITPLATVVSDTVAQRRFSMMLLALFAGVALFLAAVGLYGVVSYVVSQRTREIGLRIAMGAGPGNIVRMVLGGGMKLAVIGVVIGLAGAYALSKYVETLLYEVTPWDPASYAGTAGILLAVAALACYVPARRAMRVDPLIALQAE